MKKTAKKLMTVLMILAITVAMATGCGGGDSESAGESENLRVGLLQLTEHPSLDTIRESIIEGLADEGYVDGENITIDYKNGQNDMTNMKTIAQAFVSDGCDVIIAIATPAAQAVLSETTEIPIVFAAVTDPVDAELVDSLETPGGNVTGTSDEVSAEAIMELAKEITPGFKTIGALYSAGEDNSDSVIKGLKEYAEKNGYEVVESTVTNTSEVQQAAQYLADKADVVYSPIDNTIASAMAVASETFNNAKVPFYVSADSMVQDGGLATYGIDYTVLGKETAKMVAKILEGADVSTMSVVKMSDMNIYVNENTADAIGVTIPDSIMEKATVLGNEE